MKLKSVIAALFLMIAGLQTACGQGFRVYKSDGTVAQFSLRTDSIVFYEGIGSDVDFGPFTPVNQCIAGTWYKTKDETVTFGEDGTTDYLSGATYEFLPYQGTIIINDAEGKIVKLLRVPKVTKDYVVLSEWGGETFAVLTRTRPAQAADINGQEYIEIGGLKWATKNLGATTIAGSYETCCGDYYAWGETTTRYMTMTRTGANSATFTWKNGYGSGYSSNYPTYTGTQLDAAHDAATTQMGEGWRTPTKADFEALAMACSGSSSDEQTPISLINRITSGGIYWLTAEQTYEPEYTGVAGFLFVDKNDIDNRVFFPAAGGVYGTSLYVGGTYGNYWSSSLDTSDTNLAYYQYFNPSAVYPLSYYRYSGFTVRPVSD